MTRRTMLVVALTGAAILIAAGIAYATIPDSNGVYTACKNATGTIRLIDPSLGSTSLLGHCTSYETEISWNRQGTPGRDGVSPTVAQLAAGDPNCAAGGASITDAEGHTAYVCNGTNGTNGTNGRDFAGTFTSSNGDYTLEVADTGITLRGPGGRIELAGPVTTIRSDITLSLLAGAQLRLNGCGAPVARRGDPVTGFTPVSIGPDGGSGSFPLQGGQIQAGSPMVCSG